MKRILGLDLCGHITANGMDVAFIGNRCPIEMSISAVLVAIAIFKGQRGLAGTQFADFSVGGRLVVRMKEFLQKSAYHLTFRPAQDALG